MYHTSSRAAFISGVVSTFSARLHSLRTELMQRMGLRIHWSLHPHEHNDIGSNPFGLPNLIP